MMKLLTWLFPTPYNYADSAIRSPWRPLFAAAAGFAALALAVMWWRWGGTVEDSLHYFNTARYLRGEVPASELVAPFPYRLLVPAAAAAIPGDVRNSFALLNWLLVSAAACMTALSAWCLGLGQRGALAAGLVLPLALLGMRRAVPQLQPFKRLLLALALPPLYAALSVRVDGRAVWGLYPMLIPFAVAALSAWWGDAENSGQAHQRAAA